MADTGSLRGRILVVAFEGWNDAGESASSAVQTLRDQLEVVELARFESENLYDYQLVRPQLVFDDDGKRVIRWPETILYAPAVPQARAVTLADDAHMHITGENTSNIYLLTGPEPTRNWQSFSSEVIDLLLAADVEAVVFMGALLADAPHTRPISIFSSSDNAELRAAFQLERSTYEGPTGILAVLAQACEQVGIATISLWASVPHYVHHSPSPKATLALIDRLEELIDVTIPRGSLVEDSREWEESINDLAGQDDEMASYIATLEAARDESTGPEVSGEAIAREFERFLRDQNDDPRPNSD